MNETVPFAEILYRDINTEMDHSWLKYVSLI